MGKRAISVTLDIDEHHLAERTRGRRRRSQRQRVAQPAIERRAHDRADGTACAPSSAPSTSTPRIRCSSHADAARAALYDASLARPLLVREEPAGVRRSLREQDAVADAVRGDGHTRACVSRRRRRTPGARARRSTSNASGSRRSSTCRCSLGVQPARPRVAHQPPANGARLLRRSVQQPPYQPLDLTAKQVFLADELRFNRDPFDALICAAAQPSNCRCSRATARSADRAS